MATNDSNATQSNGNQGSNAGGAGSARGGGPVQVAQAGQASAVPQGQDNVVVITPPPPGERVEYRIEPGQTILLQGIDLSTAQIQQLDGGLLITLANGAVIYLIGFVEAAQSDNPPVIEIAGLGRAGLLGNDDFTGGPPGPEFGHATISAGDLLAAAGGQPLNIQPAAGPEGGDSGGARFGSEEPQDIGEGLPQPDLLGNEDFFGGPPEPEFGESQEEEPAPPDNTPQVLEPSNLSVDEDDLPPLGSDPTKESLTDTGSVTVDFGNDVPGVPLDNFALTTTGLPASTPGGQAITYGLSGDGLTLTATVAGVGLAYTIEVTGATDNADGTVTYDYQVTLGEAFDHVIGDDTEAPFVFNVSFEGTDSDGDPFSGAFQVTLVDDVPDAVDDSPRSVAEGGAQISGNVIDNDTEGADDATLTHVQLPGGSFVAITSGFDLGGGEFQFSVLGVGTYTFKADGSWTFTPAASVDNSSGDVDASFDYRLTDGDGDTDEATQPISVTEANSPTAGDASLVHDESAGLQGGSDNVTATEDDDDDDIAAPGALVDATEAAVETALSLTPGSLTLTAIGAVQTTPTISGGGDGLDSVYFDTTGSGIQTGDDTGIDVSSDSGDVTYVVISDNLILGVEDYVSASDFGNVVFSLHIDSTTGEFTFIQYEAVESPTPGTGAAHDEGLGAAELNIDYIVEDNDGTTDSGTVTVDIEDDGPSATESTDSRTVEEEELFGGNEDDTPNPDDADVDPVFSNTTNVAMGSLASLADFGTDGPGGFSLLVVANNAPVDSGLKSDTNTVWYVSNGTTLTGFLDDGTTANQFDGSDTVVFTLALSGTNNEDWTFTLLHHIDHAADDAEDIETIDLSGFIVITDADGDTASLAADTLTVDAIDDIPLNISPEPALLANTGSATVTNALNFFDIVGADRGSMADATFSTSNNGILTGVTTATGQAITLTVSGDGHTITAVDEDTNPVFTIVLNPDADAEGTDTYTITFFQELDDGSGVGFSFLGLQPNSDDWFGLEGDNFADDPSNDILVTGEDVGNDTVNTSNTGLGTNNQSVSPGQLLRFDFVTGLQINGSIEDDPPLGNFDNVATMEFDGHYSDTVASFTVSQTQAGARVGARVVVYDLDPADETIDGAAFAGTTEFGGGTPTRIGITSIVVTDGTGTVLEEVVWNPITMQFDVVTDDANIDIYAFVAMDNTDVAIDGLLSDYTVEVTGESSFERIEVINNDAAGSVNPNREFDISGVTVGENLDGEPVDMSFDLDVEDSDGDTSSGTLDVTVLPDITGTSSGETLNAGANGSAIFAGDGADTLNGSAEQDLLLGEGGNDTILGGGGNDLIDGGADDDMLTGGLGADTFTFSLSVDFGDDTITDFSIAEGDVLRFSDVVDDDGDGDLGLDDLEAAVTVTNDGGGNTTITVDGTSATITLSGIGDFSSVADLDTAGVNIALTG